MNSTVLPTIAATGFTVAFFHAAIPTHWLPFVLVGRARAWSRAKVMTVTIAAGLGHVLLTSLLGVIIAWLGFQLDERLGQFSRGLRVAFYSFWAAIISGANGVVPAFAITACQAVIINRANTAAMKTNMNTATGTTSCRKARW